MDVEGQTYGKSVEYPPNCSRLTQQDLIIRELEEKRQHAQGKQTDESDIKVGGSKQARKEAHVRILDIEKEKDYMEVSIWDENKEKDVYFDSKKTDRIKGLLWEGDGFLLLYKRLSNGAFNWPRSVEEALEISPEQYTMLMQGLEILPKHPIRPNDPPKRLM